MRRQREARRDEPRRGIPFKWVGAGVLVLVALVLHQVRLPVDVTLHVATHRVAFSTAGSGEIVLLRSLQLTALGVRGLPRLRLEVEGLDEEGRPLATGQGGVSLKARGPDSDLTLRAEGLRLMGIAVAPGTRVALYPDRAGQVILEFVKHRGTRIEVGVLGSTISLDAKDVAVTNADGNEVPYVAQRVVHHLEVKPASRSLVFEPQDEVPFTLVLNLREQMTQNRDKGLPLPFAPRLKVASLDFTRKEDSREVTAISWLWVEPLVPKDHRRESVFLGVPGGKVFTVHSMRLSSEGLEAELTGRTDVLKVGKDGPTENLVPSLLENVGNDLVFKTVCKIVRVC